MQKIAIITDSSCDLTINEINKFNINVLPLKIIYKDKEYNDIFDITSNEVYQNLHNEVPTTSLCSPDYINSVLDKLEEEGYTHLIGIFISSSLSGTFNAARLIIEERTTIKSFLFDSKIIGFPLGSIVLKASELVYEGKSFEEIIKDLPIIRESTTGYYTINTLEYLRKGGRIGKVAGTVGDLLHLKPIISVDENGAYCTYTKARGRKQSLKKLINIILEHLDEDKCNISILNGMAEEEANQILSSIENHPNLLKSEIRSIGAAMGVHAGPGMVGVSIQKGI
ncbi:DegV family protein [Clostridium sp.]|uniref:DegV family protein n=1 Tax=Clostridium sp. TaxID=1506 RepID=UPI0026275B59|nr:DegV family protein [Clostridium sp.]